MSSAIRTENLVKKFRKLTALDGINLDVPEGAIYALVGPNGAGKTTAIKVLMNIFRATSGRAEVLGTDSTRLRGGAFISIGYVSENQEMPGWMNLRRLLAFLRPFYPTWDLDLERELVRDLDLPLDRQLSKLSRGMRMKAAMLSSLAYHPKLIVLDEPFGGLDPLVRDQLIEGLVERASEATIFVSSHDLAEIENLASHIGYLEEGHLRFSEERAALLERFREVELTLDTAPSLDRKWPESWMHVASAEHVMRFIESRFDPERTSAEVRHLFGEPHDVTFRPMSLRSIFVAMARAGRPSAGGSTV
jgi:ABC-2 type transport system ATP-binding protein